MLPERAVRHNRCHSGYVLMHDMLRPEREKEKEGGREREREDPLLDTLWPHENAAGAYLNPFFKKMGICVVSFIDRSRDWAKLAQARGWKTLSWYKRLQPRMSIDLSWILAWW